MQHEVNLDRDKIRSIPQFLPLLTSGGVNVDYLYERGEPSIFSKNGSDGGVSGRESIEEAEEPPQFDLHGFH